MVRNRQTGAHDGPPIRVLIVDNEPHHAEAVAESLQRVGYECTVATSGPEGVRRIEQDTFDVVITDLVMNDVDGLAILAKAKETLADAEVILITGHGSIPSAVNAMQQGAFNYLLNRWIWPNCGRWSIGRRPACGCGGRTPS